MDASINLNLEKILLIIKKLDQISIIRSKGLKNEIAGFITKFIKQEIREQKENKELKNNLNQKMWLKIK